MNSAEKNARIVWPDDVGRRDARDAEAMGDLGGNRRFPGPGRAADEHEERKLQTAQRLEARVHLDREERRLGRAAVVHARAPSSASASSSTRSSRLSPSMVRTSLSQSTTGTPRSAAVSATTSIAAAFSSTR